MNRPRSWFERSTMTVFLALAAVWLIPASAHSRTLRYATTSFGEENLDPTVTSITASLGLAGPLWDWLTEVTADGKLEPSLAVSWKPSGDGLTGCFACVKASNFTMGVR